MSAPGSMPPDPPGRPPPEASEPGSQPPPGPPGAPPAAEAVRPPLRRSTSDRMLFGVAGGLGRYVGVDAVVVRIAFVLLAVFGGSGLILYLVGLIAIPEEQPHETAGQPAAASASARPSGNVPGNALAAVGVVLIVIGGFALLRQLLPGIGAVAGPLVLLAAGVLLILAARR